MKKFAESVVLLMIAGTLAACGEERLTGTRLITDAAKAMGGLEKLQAVTVQVRRGNGTRTNMGQSREPGMPEPTGVVKNYVEAVDFQNRLAGVEYDLQVGDFVQRRREVYTRAQGRPRRNIGYYTIGGASVAVSPPALVSYAAFDTPEIIPRRDVLPILLSAVDRTEMSRELERKEFNSKSCVAVKARVNNGREEATLYFDPQSRLMEGYEITEIDTVLGRIPVEYIFTDYRAVGDLRLPHRVQIRRDRKDSADFQFDSIALDLGAAKDWFTVPSAAGQHALKIAAAPVYVPLEISTIAPGLHLAQGFTHNSVIVEFSDYLVVLEAPLNNTQSIVLLRELSKLAPGKPIRYVVPTHHHHDHLGGLREVAAKGATVLTEKRLEPIVRRMLESSQNDGLAQARKEDPQAIRVEVFENSRVIADKGRRVEIHAIEGSPHASPMVIAYLPRERIVFQSDLFPSAPPVAKHFYVSIASLRLRPGSIVGGHGPVLPIAELAKFK